MNRDAILKQINQESREKALNNGAYTGYELISALKDISDRNKTVYINMKSPIYDDNYNVVAYYYQLVSSDFKCDSWRGSYNLPSVGYVALDISDSVEVFTVQDIIKNIEESEGLEVSGWKGGDFTLSMDDVIYVANQGESNNAITVVNIEELPDVVILHTEPDMY